MEAPIAVRRLLTLDEVSACAHVPSRSIRRDVALGELRAVHVGTRALRVPAGTARAYLQRVSPRSVRRLHRIAPLTRVYPKRLYHTGEIGRLLSVTPQHVRNLLRARCIGHLRFEWSSHTYVPGEAFLAYLKSLR
jgi:hypothetical protein